MSPAIAASRRRAIRRLVLVLALLPLALPGCAREETGAAASGGTASDATRAASSDAPDSPARGSSPPDSPVLATVGDRAITTEDVDEHIRRQLFERMVASQGPARIEGFRDRALEDLIDELVLEREARRRGVTPEVLLEGERRAVRDEEVEAYFERHRARWGADATLDGHFAEIRQLLLAKRKQEVMAALREGEELDVQSPSPDRTVVEEGFAIGPGSAPVTLVAFADYASTNYRRTQPVLDALVARHPGALRLLVRHLPDDRHPRSRALAASALCAEAQGRFPAFQAKLLANPREVADEDLERYADDVGMELDAFDACLASPAIGDRIDRDVRAARKVGIEVSPGFWLNGQVIAGPRPVDIFERMIATHLDRTERAGAVGAGW